MHSFNSTRPNPYAYWNMPRLHTHDTGSDSVSPSASTQRRTYQRLERLPFSDSSGPTFSFGLSSAWRKLVQLLVNELVEEQRVDYLERCWAASDPCALPNPPIKQFLSLIQ